MLEELYAAIGNRRGLSYVTGIPVLTLENWRNGTRTPSPSGKRAVWLLWAMLLHPERCRTLTDLASWGRFRTPTAAPGAVPCGIGHTMGGMQEPISQAHAPQDGKWFWEI